ASPSEVSEKSVVPEQFSRSDGKVEPMEKAASFSGKANIRLGPIKYKFCRRLGDSHSDLALYLGIPPQDSSRWKAGSECEKILEWLENRDRLGELPEALEEIGREDLVDLIS
ncbi:MAG: hypothetical protein O4808_02140, partial [Trichodesmium sp. St17_bin3_1_1]|nr:hypothetical protein [Trichodesmium sp. St17_bin3_1_1]